MFAERLEIRRGVTALIGAGGKTSLLSRLADELSRRGTVLVTTTTHIRRPPDLPFSEAAREPAPVLCVGTPCADGKLTAPREPFAALAGLADYVLVEADGAKERPLKAHAAHEPVIPLEATQVVCVVGASGLYGPVHRVVHRPELFTRLTGGAEIATPAAVARLLRAEHLHDRVFINQADTNLAAAQELEALLSCPVVVAALHPKEGEACLF